MILYYNYATPRIRKRYQLPRFNDLYVLEKSILHSMECVYNAQYTLNNFPIYEPVLYYESRDHDARWVPIIVAYNNIVYYLQSLKYMSHYTCMIEDIFITKNTYIGYKHSQFMVDKSYEIMESYVYGFHLFKRDKCIVFPYKDQEDESIRFRILSSGMNILNKSWFVHSTEQKYALKSIIRKCTNITRNTVFPNGGDSVSEVFETDDLPDKPRKEFYPIESADFLNNNRRGMYDKDFKYSEYIFKNDISYTRNMTPGIHIITPEDINNQTINNQEEDNMIRRRDNFIDKMNYVGLYNKDVEIHYKFRSFNGRVLYKYNASCKHCTDPMFLDGFLDVLRNNGYWFVQLTFGKCTFPNGYPIITNFRTSKAIRDKNTFTNISCSLNCMRYFPISIYTQLMSSSYDKYHASRPNFNCATLAATHITKETILKETKTRYTGFPLPDLGSNIYDCMPLINKHSFLREFDEIMRSNVSNGFIIDARSHEPLELYKITVQNYEYNEKYGFIKNCIPGSYDLRYFFTNFMYQLMMDPEIKTLHSLIYIPDGSDILIPGKTETCDNNQKFMNKMVYNKVRMPSFFDNDNA